MQLISWASVAKEAARQDWIGAVPTVPLQLFNAVMIVHASHPCFWLRTNDVPSLLEQHPHARDVILAHNEDQIAHAIRAVNIATTTRHNI